MNEAVTFRPLRRDLLRQMIYLSEQASDLLG
jgi:hypothetical protein